MKRILILMTASGWQEAADALRSSKSNAASPSRLCYGLCLMEEPTAEQQKEMLQLGTVNYITGTYTLKQRFDTFWQGEAKVLSADPAMRFARRWDIRLMQQQYMAGLSCNGKAALSGYLPAPSDPVDAVMPVAADRFGHGGVLIYRKGTPLRYARDCERAAFLHPGFIFATSAFFRDLKDNGDPYFLTAFRRGWQIATPNRVAIRFALDVPVPSSGFAPDEQDFDFLDEFGVDLENKTLSPQAQTGIFRVNLTYPLRVPVGVRLQESRRAYQAKSDDLQPLLVTARLRGMQLNGSEAEQERRFRNLCEINLMPLLCYADGEFAKRSLLYLSNVLEYKRRYALPVKGDIIATEADRYLRLSKLFLMSQARERFLNYSHFGWIDPDYLGWVVYKKAYLDWDAICKDKIVFAMVQGEPDASLLIVPEPLLTEFKNAMMVKTIDYLRRFNSLPEEARLLRELMAEHEDWFEPQEMPERRSLLELTMTVRGEEYNTKA